MMLCLLLIYAFNHLDVLTCCLLASLASVQALYDASSDVQSLTDADFNSRVIQSDQLWLVEFYAPW